MVFEANTRKKAEHTKRKGEENCARNGGFLCTILFKVSGAFLNLCMMSLIDMIFYWLTTGTSSRVTSARTPTNWVAQRDRSSTPSHSNAKRLNRYLTSYTQLTLIQYRPPLAFHGSMKPEQNIIKDLKKVSSFFEPLSFFLCLQKKCRFFLVVWWFLGGLEFCPWGLDFLPFHTKCLILNLGLHTKWVCPK